MTYTEKNMDVGTPTDLNVFVKTAIFSMKHVKKKTKNQSVIKEHKVTSGLRNANKEVINFSFRRKSKRSMETTICLITCLYN